MLNVTAIQGRMVADPELRTTNNGTSVCSFTLAVQRNMKGSDGEYNTDWVDCVAWKGTAEFICKNFQKGQLVAVNGTLQTRSYEKDGVKRKATEVLVQNANFCESRKKEEPKQSSTISRGTEPQKEYEQQAMLSPDDFLGDDDLPFN